EALLLLSDERVSSAPYVGTEVKQLIESSRRELDQAGCDWRTAVIEGRYGRIAQIQQKVATETIVEQETFSDKLDRILTHKLWGMLIFVGIMSLMFQSIFSLAEYPMKGIQAGVGQIGEWIGHAIPPGALHSLLVDGVIAGVGAVVVFLPQIC